MLLERGQGFWFKDNLELLQKGSVNLGVRGQIYHHDYEELIADDPEVTILTKERMRRGMIYYYVIQKK